MANKKKNSKKQPRDKNAKGILGTNVSGLGTAAAGAIVAEVAQAAISRMVESATNSDRIDATRRSVNNSVNSATGEVNERIDATRNSISDAAATVKDAIENATPSVKDAVNAIKGAVDDIKPAISDVVDSLKGKAEEAKDSVEGVVEGTVDTVAESVDATKHALDSKPEKKKKKGKKGKKKAA
ncbi:MAG: hypothetical protein HC769_09560 [Cyanobacteria bacterium CRU_2_1]|nr:hypothetical protein [Cyanobacteria bacterium CRU_2_1]